MTLDEQVAAFEKACDIRAKEIDEFLKQLNATIKGVDVTITAKYPRRAHGRKAVIDYVSFFDGRVIYSLNFFRKDGTGYLDNKPTWVRQCWNRGDFEFC